MGELNTQMNNTTGILPMINNLMMQGPGQGYGGPSIAGFTPLQMQGWGSMMGGAQNVQGAGQGLMGMYGNAVGQGGNVNAMQVGPGQNFDWMNASNPFMQSAVQGAMDQTSQSFNRNVMPGLAANSAMAGQSGSSRAGVAQALAANDLNQINSNMANQAYSGMYDANMNRAMQQRQQNIGVMQGNQAANLQGQLANQGYQQSLYGMMPGMMDSFTQSQMMPGSVMGDIGGQQQGMNQAQLNAAQSSWEGGQNANMEYLQDIMGMLTGSGAGGYSSTQSSGGK